MTLNDILVAALAQLDRGHDPQTLDVWRDKFTRFANDAQDDLARALRLRRREQLALPQDGVLDLARLSRGCRRVVAVTRDGREVAFATGDLPGTVQVEGEGPVTVEYVCLPRRLNSPSDVPELPDLCHPLIVSYVVGREHMAGRAGAAGAALYFQLYQAGKAGLRPHMGEPAAYRLYNRW